MEGMGKKPRRRRSFTPEFKAEIVELCERQSRGQQNLVMAHRIPGARDGRSRHSPFETTGLIFWCE
jgi:hypothetical protein